MLTIIATKNKLFPQSRENSLFLVGNLWVVLVQPQLPRAKYS
jgi:hypothetical protein